MKIYLSGRISGLDFEKVKDRFNGTEELWAEIRTYGGRLVENIVQAIARDVLAEAICTLEDKGLPVVFHVHDEVVVEHEQDKLKECLKVFSTPPEWAYGLPLEGEGFITDYYKKD